MLNANFVCLTVLNNWQMHLPFSGAHHVTKISPYQDKIVFNICPEFIRVHSVLPACVTEEVLEALSLYLDYFFFKKQVCL